MPVIPGDIVVTPAGDRVVVDVAHEWDGDWAVLRRVDDLEGLALTAAPADGLTVTGHVAAVPGWREGAPGEWVRR